jgi:hypothetical protein
MDKVAQYFSNLACGKGLMSFDTLQSNLNSTFTYYPTNNIIYQFWAASGAASLLPDINDNAKEDVTKKANIFLFNSLPKLDNIIDDPKLDTQHMERLMEIYVRLQAVPSPAMATKILDRTKNHIEIMDSHFLTSSLKQFVKMSIYPGDDWMNTWWKTASPKSKKWSLKEVCALMYRLALLDFVRSKDHHIDKSAPSPCRQIAEEFLGVLEKKAKLFFPDKIDTQIFFAGKWFGKKFVDDLPIQSESCRSSRIESRFAQVLAKRDIIVKTEGVIIPKMGHKTDLELINGKSHAAETDGFLHFHRVTMRAPFERAVSFNLSTRFQSWLMSDLCPELHILRVPYFHCFRAMKNQPWEETLHKLDEKKPGVYAYHGDGQIKNMADKNGHLFRDQSL